MFCCHILGGNLKTAFYMLVGHKSKQACTDKGYKLFSGDGPYIPKKWARAETLAMIASKLNSDGTADQN